MYFFVALLIFNGLSNLHAQIRKGDKPHKHKSKKTKYSSAKPVDSAQSRREFVRDSVAAVRAYRDSKHYRDSTAKAIALKARLQKETRDTQTDSLKNARQHIVDSASLVRKTRTDSVRAFQKNRTDSLARITKYKASKRYADSTTLAHREHADSIKRAQTHFRDSITTVRKHVLDSAKLSRKHVMDSVKIVRTKHMDSIKIVRKAKTDSLAKVKSDKEKLAKAAEKKKQDAQKLKLEIKFKQKREAWSNQQMLKKPWSPVRRVFQNAFTHYNYYYNANKKMDEALVNMQRSRKENYDSLINLYPFDPNKDSAKMKGDMDTIIRKASVGIQIHDPRVKWENDLLLLLGEANYYKGKYEVAATSFKYIIARDEEKKKKEAQQSGSAHQSKTEPTIVEGENTSKLEFLKHKSVHNDAILWLARTYTSWHKVENAESVISLLESDRNLPDDLKGRLAAEKAFAYLDEQNDQAAITQLQIVQSDAYLPDWLRMRAAFLCGQLLQNRKEYEGAIVNFENVLDFYPKLEMDFYTRKNIAYNYLMAGQDAATAMRPLKKVLNDGKYVNYYDQVYYVLGKLAIQAHETDEAINYLNKSISTPKATKKQKGMSFAALGDAWYASGQYKQAKSAYDSAAKYMTGSKDTLGLANVGRSKTLSNIVGPATQIHDLDSLLQLAGMSKKEQLATVHRYQKYLEKIQQDSIIAAENAIIAGIQPPAETASEASDYSNWYFSNPSLVQQGSSEFKRKWGNRKLTDNWRRAAANSFTGGGQEDEIKETPDTEEATENGIPSEKALLDKIPNTPEQKQKVIRAEQKAFIQLAKAYYNLLDDYANCLATLDKLDVRFPSHEQKEEELYLRYQVAIKQNQLDKAQSYARELIEKFPESEYAKLLKPRESSKSESAGTQITEAKYYDETYELLMRHQYSEALVHTQLGLKQFDNPVFKKRFMVAEVMAQAGMGDLDNADSSINRFLKTYPATDTLSGWATSIREYVADVRKNGVPKWYKPTPPSGEKQPEPEKEKPTVDSTKIVAKKEDVKPKFDSALEIPAAYQNIPTAPHFCMVILPGIDSRVTNLRKHIASFDSAKYKDSKLDIILDFFDMDKTVLLVKKFSNAEDAEKYRSDLMTSSFFVPFKTTEFRAVIISAQNYSKMYSDKKISNYLGFYDAVLSR